MKQVQHILGKTSNGPKKRPVLARTIQPKMSTRRLRSDPTLNGHRPMTSTGQETWKTVSHRLRLLAVAAVAGIALIFLAVAAALVLWLILIAVIHFTIPAWSWLNSAELTKLGTLYSNSAKFIAPTALITNAWLIAYFSLRSWRALRE